MNKYQQHKFPNVYGDSLILSHHTPFYKICSELYKDMKNILGNELLEKWRNIDENDNIIKYNNSYDPRAKIEMNEIILDKHLKKIKEF